MRYVALSMIFAASIALPDRPNPSPRPMTAPDLETLQGTWVVIDYETPNGKMNPQGIKNHSKLVINGDKFGWSTPSGQFKLDPTKTPKTIDYWFGSNYDPKSAWHGIYELNGDTFRDCIASPGQPRPTDFAT